MASRPKSTAPLSLVRGFTPPEDIGTLAQAKLVSSGLDLADARKLGLTWHTAGETQQLCPIFWGLPSLRIPYFHPATKEPLTSRPHWPVFFRQRALREPVPLPERFKKYLQPPDTGLCPYFPTNYDWKPLLQDHTHYLIITEGELKAAKACKEGFPTIGLGGVNSYRSYRSGIEFLPLLEEIAWPRREVFLIFDSDVQGNSNVCHALNDLAQTLARRGAIPKLVLLPSGANGEKMGLDDFLLSNHPDVLRQMLLLDAVHLAFAQPLWLMNERYAYIPMLDRVIRRGESYLSSVGSLRTAETAVFFEQVLKDNGSLSTQRVSATEQWLSWPLRQDVKRLTYVPGLDPLALIPSEAPSAQGDDADYNLWTGWGCVPKAGDLKPFLALVDHLFTGATSEAKQWFLRWCAYPLQFPGTKLFSSVVIHGLAQGTGKSLIGYTLGKIYGKNFTEIDQADLHGSFNEWAIGKQLIMGDDVTGSDKLQDRDKLKKMITQKEIRINAKNQPTYLLPDCINYYWTSNQFNAFFLEDRDRRFFIHEVTADPMPFAFYEAYAERLNFDPSFSAAVFHYLLNLDLGDFKAAGPALTTVAKEHMTRNTRSDIDNWVVDLVEAPDDWLLIGEARLVGDLFTNKELLAVYAAQLGVAPESLPAKRLASALARVGVRQVHDGLPVRAPGRHADRYYAIRNSSKWLRATLPQLQAHLAMPARPPVHASEKPKVKKPGAG